MIFRIPRGCSSLKIFSMPITCSVCTLTRTDTCQFHAWESAPGLRLRCPTISSSRRGRTACYIYRPFIPFRGQFRDALFHLRCSRAFRNAQPSQSSGRANLSEDRSRIALFIGIRTFPTIFSKYRTERRSAVARTSLYKCILLLYRCTVIRYRK